MFDEEYKKYIIKNGSSDGWEEHEEQSSYDKMIDGLILITIVLVVGFLVWGVTTDCPNTATYVYCGSE